MWDRWVGHSVNTGASWGGGGGSLLALNSRCIKMFAFLLVGDYYIAALVSR